MNSIEIVPFQHDHLGGKATLVATRYWVERGINKSFLFIKLALKYMNSFTNSIVKYS